MAASTQHVSERGHVGLPDAVLRRWDLVDGGEVKVVDLGHAVIVAPVGDDGCRSMVRAAVDETGGYSALVAAVALDEPDLA